MKARLVRYIVLTVGLLLAVSGIAGLVREALASAPAPKIELRVDAAQPREVEDATQKAIARDYAAAWQAIATALADNNEGALAQGLVGIARDKFGAAVAGQKAAGMRTRLVDKGHQVEALFYSPEGSAMQLRDTVRLERQVLDGDKVVHREEVTARYVAVMSVTESGWKLRVLEEVPAF